MLAFVETRSKNTINPKLSLYFNREDPEGETALHVLSKKSDVIGSSSELSFWKRHMNSRNTHQLSMHFHLNIILYMSFEALLYNDLYCCVL